MMLGRYVDADFIAMFNNENLDINGIHIIPSSFEIQDLIDGKVDAFNSYLSNNRIIWNNKALNLLLFIRATTVLISIATFCLRQKMRLDSILNA